MNQPPGRFVRVPEAALLTFATACFEKAGLDHDHAALISRLLVNADLRGVRSHGTRTVHNYCRSFIAGALNPDLRYSMTIGSADAVRAVVIDGALKHNGMVSFASAVKPADAEAIRHYLIKRANEDKALGRPASTGARAGGA